MQTSPLPNGLRPGLLLLALLPAVFTTPAQAAQEYIKSYTVNGRAQVRVRADEGRVRVVTSEGSEVEFHVKLEGVEWGVISGVGPHVESHQDGSQVALEARLGHSVVGLTTRRMSIEVRMPRQADLEVDTGDGSVELTSINGHITVHTGDGSIRAAQLAGDISFASGDGSISADDLQGDVRMHSGDGAIRAASLQGRCVAESRDGSVQVAGRFHALDLRSGDGSLTARVEPGSQMDGPWSLNTSDGSVRLALPPDFRASLDASTGDGRISSGLPVQSQGEFSHHKLQGTINGGGPALVIHTGDGSIKLSPL